MISMGSPRKVLILTGDEQAAAAITAVLDKGPLEVDVLRGGIDALVARLETDPPDAVLLDIDPNPEQMLRDLAGLIRQFPAIPFVVLGRELVSDWILATMKAGAKYFQAKSCIDGELLDVLRRVAPESTEARSPGTMITVLSAGGGCGATTLAVNLADQLRLSCGSPSLLVDLDTCYGTVCEYLGLKAQYGLADVLAHTDRIDAQLVGSTVLTHSSGLQVLASPVSSNFTSPAVMNYEQLPWALEVFQQMSRYTVIDAPRVGMNVAQMLAAHSKATLIVFQLNVKDVRVARSMVLALKDRGVSAESLLAVACRTGDKHTMVKLDDARKVIGVPMTDVCTDYRSAVRSMNLAQLLSQSAPRSALCRAVARLAARICQTAESYTASTRGNST